MRKYSTYLTSICSLLLAGSLSAATRSSTSYEMVRESNGSAGGAAAGGLYSEEGDLNMVGGAASSADFASTSGFLGAEQGDPDILLGSLLDGVGQVVFGTVTVGSSSATRTFTITNPGTGVLTGLSVVKDGAHASDFTVSLLSATTLPVGSGEVTFRVTFTPTKPGTRTAAIHLSSNVIGAKASFDIALSGTGMSVYEVWAEDRGVSKDPFANGGSELMKFAFGQEPGSGSVPLVYEGTFNSAQRISASGTPITLGEPTTNGLDFRALFVRRSDYVSAGLIYLTQFSADLVNWVNSNATPVVLADDGTHQIVSVPYPPNVGKKKARFFRVSVGITP